MKKITKNLLSGGALLATLGTVASIAVSCASTTATTNDLQVYIALDGSDHSVLDKSFNEQSYNGANRYLQETDTTWVAGEVAPASPSAESDFLQMYSNIPSGSTVIAPGFLHADPLTNATTEIEGKNFVLLDGEVTKANIASVLFSIEHAAYIAGIVLARYLSGLESNDAANEQDINGDGVLKVGTFGGLDIPTVTGFMGGLQSGIEYYNTINNEATSGFKDIEFIKLANRADHFTGSFSSGDGTALATELLNEGADVILPVSGPQTADVAIVITENTTFDARILGVDSAQEEQYSQYQDLFLFSILKNLEAAAYDTLQKLAPTIATDGTLTPNPSASEVLNSTQVGTLENGWIGITNFTTSIYNDFNNYLNDQAVVGAAELVDPFYFFDAVSTAAKKAESNA